MSTTITKRKAGRRSNGRRTSSTAPNAVGKYASDAWSLAKRTAIGLNEIRKFINIEEKYIDTTFSATVSYNGSATVVSQVVQGLDINNRVGDSIRLQHVELRFTVNCDSSALTTACRIMMLRDLDGQGTAPAVNTILDPAGIGSVNAVNAPLNELNLTRFSVLFDETVTICNAGPGQAVGSYSAPHHGHVRYYGTTAAAGSDGKGSVYILCVSDRVTTLLPTFNWFARMTFTDD